MYQEKKEKSDTPVLKIPLMYHYKDSEATLKTAKKG